MYDFHGDAFIDARNIGPRVGVIYNPSGDGRSKVSVAYGRYYEAMPLSIAARYSVARESSIRYATPNGTCANTRSLRLDGQNRATGGAATSRRATPPTRPPTRPPAASSSPTTGPDYPLQADLAGQYHNEVTATVERELRRGAHGPARLPAPLARQHHRGRLHRQRRLYVHAREPGQRPEVGDRCGAERTGRHSRRRGPGALGPPPMTRIW